MSFNKTKANPELGQLVHQHLVKVGVETPTITNGLSRTDKIEIIEAKFKDIMNTLAFIEQTYPTQEFFNAMTKPWTSEDIEL